MYSRLLLSAFIFLITNAVMAQSATPVTSAYESYTELPRENIFVHLNKSTYLQGEMLGFTAYVFDKSTKATSQLTTNLYCTIVDENDIPIKKALIRVEEGTAFNVFNIDSSFSKGKYTFKAYTNWMRNFKEPNHFEAPFTVMGPNDSSPKAKYDNLSEIDLQILGEGGHILYNVNNTVGIIAKDKYGYGLKGVRGTIRDNNNAIVTEFSLNEVGLAKALFNPRPDKSYYAVLEVKGKPVRQAINSIKHTGIVMSVAPGPNTLNILMSTNAASLKLIENHSYTIVHHNGVNITEQIFTLDSNGRAVLSFSNDNLYSGMNIFTIFDDQNRPLLERLYFNNEGIKHLKPLALRAINRKDSLEVELAFDIPESVETSHLSISVLPKDTKSYNHHHSILSQLYIRPYINGYLENGDNYFKKQDRVTAYNLDLLMLTQGWSSYDWSTIFNAKNSVLKYPFEEGINISLTSNGEKKGTYLVYPFDGENTQLLDVREGNSSIELAANFPKDEDRLRVTFIDAKTKNSTNTAGVYPRFRPNEIPDYENNYAILNDIGFYKPQAVMESVKIPEAWKQAEQLDEVVVKGELQKTKAEIARERAIFTKVVILNGEVKVANRPLYLHLQTLGYLTNYNISSGQLSIVNPRARGGNTIPAVYLDGALIGGIQNSNMSILLPFTTKDIDYIEYDPYGVQGGGGLSGAAGFIKIFTKPMADRKNKRINVSTFDIPLRFNKTKTFYTPKYYNFEDQFFEDYGAIGWYPNLKLTNNGKVSLKIDNSRIDHFTLFIEGVVNGNQFISKTLDITPETN